MYRFYYTKNKVICVSSYAGKPIRGIAKCAPGDEFDIEIGKKLAQLRCDLKVAKAREKRANEMYCKALDAYDRAEIYCDKMEDYAWDAAEAATDAQDALNEFMSDMGC